MRQDIGAEKENESVCSTQGAVTREVTNPAKREFPPEHFSNKTHRPEPIRLEPKWLRDPMGPMGPIGVPMGPHWGPNFLYFFIYYYYYYDFCKRERH